jgi:hypothetical protein
MANVTTVSPASTLPVATAISVTLDNDGALMANVVMMNNGTVDAGNTTTDPLGIDEVFTGIGINVIEYASIIISCTADAPSATDGVEFQFGTDGITYKTTDNYTYTNGGACKTWAVQTVGPYFRIKYTNGGTAQTAFNLCTQFKKVAGVTSSHRVADNIEGQDDAALTKTILMAERAGGTPDVYININATAGGNLKTSIEEIEAGVIIPTAPSDNLSMSEFGEQRVAPPGNRSDVEFIYDKQPLLVDDISTGGGTATHQASSRDILLSINNTTTGTIAGMRQHYAVPYTPGSGQEIDHTGVMDKANLGGVAAVFLRSTVTGTTTLETIPQSAWTAKKTGVNWQYAQIFRISFQSLKVGRIQFSLVSDGIPTKVAEINNDNVRASGYWQTATLPPYWKVYNTASNTIVEFGYGDEYNGVGFLYTMAKSASATAVAICSTVKSQGGDRLFEMPGFHFMAFNTASPLATTTVSTTFIPVLSFRIAATFNGFENRALYIPASYTVKTDNPIHYQILFRPTLTGANFVPLDTIPYSGIEYDVTASAVTGGYILGSDFIQSGIKTSTSTTENLGRIIMALGYTGTSDILTIAAIRDASSNANVSAIFKGLIIR